MIISQDTALKAQQLIKEASKNISQRTSEEACEALFELLGKLPFILSGALSCLLESDNSKIVSPNTGVAIRILSRTIAMIEALLDQFGVNIEQCQREELEAAA